MAANEDSELSYGEPMARHTSWRVGGAADVFFRPRSVTSLQRFLRSQPAGTPLTWVGLGSNLLVRDGGIRGAVVCLSGLPRDFECSAAGYVRAGAGLPCATLARQAARARLGPAAFFAGIPGTLGGALAMNAGAFGAETWDRVVSVETVDARGERRERRREEFEIGYRTVRGHGDACFIGAAFEFDEQVELEAAEIRSLLERRRDTQPIGPPSAGSVFRNPPGAHAAALIEQAGLKGFRIGAAIVSEKHANFILNEGEARAWDIEALILHVQAEVEARHGVRLEPEVRIVGEADGAPA
jgi:UDP-N-acetylmuramate dehydrogenase